MKLACNSRQAERWRAQLDVVLKRLDAHYKAEEAILCGAQEYRIGTRLIKRGELPYIQSEIRKLENEKCELENALENCISPNKRKSYRVIYRDL